MSYYDPNYWRQPRRHYSYVPFPVAPYRSPDPLVQLGLTRKEATALVACVYCGSLIPIMYQSCPTCGCPNNVYGGVYYG